MNARPNAAVAPKIAVPDSAIEAVRGSLAPNAIGADSVEFYRAVLDAAGIDPDSLSFAETVEVTRRLYAASADFRRDRADIRKSERAAAEAAAKAKREAERKAKLAERKAKLEAEIAKLGG